MNYERAKTYLYQRGQEQLLEYYEELSESERKALLNQIKNLNFSIIKNIEKIISNKMHLNTCNKESSIFLSNSFILILYPPTIFIIAHLEIKKEAFCFFIL